MGIKQEGLEFSDKFEMYLRSLHITECRYLLGLFLNGLKDEVRAELKLHSFHTLDQLMNLAEMVESRNNLLLKGSAKVRGRFSGSQNVGRTGGTPLNHRVSGLRPTVVGGATGRKEPKSGGQGLRGKGFRQLSNEEYKEKRIEGLYFACDKRYTSEHVCKNK